MKKNGFTLIELLAIITILAIIATITSVIVLNMIDDTKESSFNSSLQGIYRAIEEDYTSNGYITDQTYIIKENTFENVTIDGSDTTVNYTVKFNGKINSADGKATVSYDDTVGALVINMKVESSEYCGENISKDGINEFSVKKGTCE